MYLELWALPSNVAMSARGSSPTVKEGSDSLLNTDEPSFTVGLLPRATVLGYCPGLLTFEAQAKALFPKLLPKKRGDLPSINRFPRHFARCVMSTWQPDDVEWQVVASSFGDCFV